MRGKAFSNANGNVGLGITPAYAGKSKLGSNGCNFPVGSPPPMRGKAVTQKNAISRSGITPAYAGKREFFTTVLRSSRDHPRLCGEKYYP